MAPFGNDDKQTLAEHSSDSSDSSELKTVRKQSDCIKNKNMEETNCSKDSAVIDVCSENGACKSATVKTSSTTTLQSVRLEKKKKNLSLCSL